MFNFSLPVYLVLSAQTERTFCSRIFMSTQTSFTASCTSIVPFPGSSKLRGSRVQGPPLAPNAKRIWRYTYLVGLFGRFEKLSIGACRMLKKATRCNKNKIEKKKVEKHSTIDENGCRSDRSGMVWCTAGRWHICIYREIHVPCLFVSHCSTKMKESID